MQKVSIITATFNSGATFGAALESIVAQGYRPLQYVVVDGASTDNTHEVFESYLPRFKEAGIEVNWKSEPDSGIFDAWNKGLALSNGEWIGFLGSDDIYADTAISTLVKAAGNSNPDFVTAKCRFIRNGKEIRTFGEPWNWSVFRREMKILHAGGLHNRTYFERYGNFDVSYKVAGDYELLLRAGSDLKVNFVDQFLVNMGAEGVSSEKVFSSLREARKARVRNGVRNPLLAWIDMYWVLVKIRVKRGFQR